MQSAFCFTSVLFVNVVVKEKMSSRVTISGYGLDHIGGGVSGSRSNQSASQRRQRSRWVHFQYIPMIKSIFHASKLTDFSTHTHTQIYLINWLIFKLFYIDCAMMLLTQCKLLLLRCYQVLLYFNLKFLIHWKILHLTLSNLTNTGRYLTLSYFRRFPTGVEKKTRRKKKNSRSDQWNDLAISSCCLSCLHVIYFIIY